MDCDTTKDVAIELNSSASLRWESEFIFDLDIGDQIDPAGIVLGFYRVPACIFEFMQMKLVSFSNFVFFQGLNLEADVQQRSICTG